jgi:hypothetical protein
MAKIVIHSIQLDHHQVDNAGIRIKAVSAVLKWVDKDTTKCPEALVGTTVAMPRINSGVVNQHQRVATTMALVATKDDQLISYIQ